MNAILLIVVVFAWGLSWYGILLQVGEASALISVTYRFYMAAAVMCAGLWLTGRLKPIPPSDHKLLAALGFCLFSMNFLCFYIAANYLPSGILSVVFATAAIFGAINGWLFLGQKLEAKVFLAAGLGLVGLALLLSPEDHSRTVMDVQRALIPRLESQLQSKAELIGDFHGGDGIEGVTHDAIALQQTQASLRSEEEAVAS